MLVRPVHVAVQVNNPEKLLHAEQTVSAIPTLGIRLTFGFDGPAVADAAYHH